MNRKAFSLIELLIVVAIIAILAGVAVPYYNDYIVDSRTAVLQNNLAAIRKAINQFRGDNMRGPSKLDITVAGAKKVSGNTDPFDELVNGPLQLVAGQWVRRANLKYLNQYPQLLDPITGEEIPLSRIRLIPGNTYIAGAAQTSYSVDQPAFTDSIGDGVFHPFDINPFNHSSWTDGTASTTLDYVDIFIQD